jgi:hypothetical protein
VVESLPSKPELRKERKEKKRGTLSSLLFYPETWVGLFDPYVFPSEDFMKGTEVSLTPI